MKNIEIKIDTGSKTPVYDQIKQEIKLSIASGKLLEDEKMPSIRELASSLQINHNTIVKVYFQLDIEGYLYSQKGIGYFVKKNKDDRNIEKYRILDELTKEYLEKISKLGFSTEEIIKSLNKK
ncbi:MAG: GntR family transcriptional regulator [Candidatus Delongbacteria bacterium]|nr:GntR family transcriptional regulator [Candidatus Delongbacteria bacterium]